MRRRFEAALSLLPARPYTTLSVVSDAAAWVLDEEAREIVALARSLGRRAGLDRGLAASAAQCRHFTSQFILLEDAPFATRHRISLDYLHGSEGSDPVFDELRRAFARRRERLHRIRVSHSRMEALLLEAGAPRERLHRIPLGVSLASFPRATPESRRAARRRLGIPEAAVVLGSFQKDGVGWGEGLEPKRIKGPDVLLKAVEILKARVPELMLLLTGPARGFVRQGLERLGVPQRHVRLGRAAEVAPCYHALDAYLVTSRDEGGPKAVLEAMASGVPLVTTRVGQARDLVQHGANGFMVESDDSEGLAHFTLSVLGDAALRERVLGAGRATAEAHSYAAQRPLWERFLDGYVEPR